MAIRLIVFDLDETMVHATEAPLRHPHGFRVGSCFVHVRPFASALIDFCASRRDVGVGSSADEPYVAAVTERLFGAAAGDSLGKLQRQPARHVHVSAFTGDFGDDALLDVIERIRSRLDGDVLSRRGA